MYEPIRSKSVHAVAGAPDDFPHRTREEELDIQLAGHLSALLTVIDEIRALAPDTELDAAAGRLTAQVERLRGTGTVAGASVHPAETADTGAGHDDPRAQVTGLHRHAHALAGRALVVAASRADTAAAILAAECMDVHAAGSAAGPVKSEVAASR